MNLPKPSLPEPLAEAGVGRQLSRGPARTVLHCLDLPLPRRGVLSGKSVRTSRRWRLFFVRSLWAFLNRAAEIRGMSLR